jgi:hypothetical protein
VLFSPRICLCGILLLFARLSASIWIGVAQPCSRAPICRGTGNRKLKDPRRDVSGSPVLTARNLWTTGMRPRRALRFLKEQQIETNPGIRALALFLRRESLLKHRWR